jgi:SNW domain-containing protein 1
MFDQRLFNQTEGMDAGYVSEDDYNIYDKPLFRDRTQADIYRNVKDTLDEEKPEDKSKPVEFEKVQEDEFGLSNLAKKVREKFD